MNAFITPDEFKQLNPDVELLTVSEQLPLDDLKYQQDQAPDDLWQLSAEEELARSIHQNRDFILIQRHPDPEAAGLHLVAWQDTPDTYKRQLMAAARLALNAPTSQPPLSIWEATARRQLWETSLIEPKAFEPKPDPSHERIATALEQLVDLHPARQRQAEDALRSQLEKLSEVLRRKQDCIDRAYRVACFGNAAPIAAGILAPETAESGQAPAGTN